MGVSAVMNANLNLAELIVLTLKDFGRAVPTDYLAKVLNQRPEYVQEYLEELEQKQIVRRQNDMVELTPEE